MTGLREPTKLPVLKSGLAISAVPAARLVATSTRGHLASSGATTERVRAVSELRVAMIFWVLAAVILLLGVFPVVAFGQTSVVNGVAVGPSGTSAVKQETTGSSGPANGVLGVPTAGGAMSSLIPTLGGGGAVAGGSGGSGGGMQLPDLTKRENFSPAMQIIVLLTVLSLAPSILLMMTCFTRIIIVLSLLRQALGTQQLPPNQVMVGLALFMTFVVMGPTLQDVNKYALQPYMAGEMTQVQALDQALKPMRAFMTKQIEASGNEADVDLFMSFAKLPEAKTWDEVPTLSLIPAFILSELKTAFLIGFKVYLPFLVIDMVISTVLISMGMMMLPPVLISLPFKLLLFVLVDGWHLIAGSLMGSFVT